MKYILLLIFTFSLFSQSIENPKSASTDNTIKPTKTIELEKESTEGSQSEASKENTKMTQAEMRKKRKLEIGIGYGEGNDMFSEAPGFLNLNLQYNLMSRFSIGYSHLHKRKFSTSPYIITIVGVSVTEETNSLEVGLLNFRYYFFEKFPLYLTGGIGRDLISHYNLVQYQYGYLYNDRSIVNSPVIREVHSPLAYYRFYGLGFQWIFQNGFFMGVEQLTLHTRYEYKYNFLILDKNYSTEGILLQPFLYSDYQEKIKTPLSNIRLGYSLQF